MVYRKVLQDDCSIRLSYMAQSVRQLFEKTQTSCIVRKVHMLRWMYDKPRQDKISDERLRRYLEIAPIDDKFKER